MREKILAYVRKNKGTSFAELRRVVGEESFDGPLTWETDAPGIVFWDNLSQEFVDTMMALKGEGLIQARPCTVLVYLVDGMMMRLPVAKRPTRKGYKTDHWLPIVFDAVDQKVGVAA